MATYRYRGTDRQGTELVGTIECDSRQQAIERLHAHGFSAHEVWGPTADDAAAVVDASVDLPVDDSADASFDEALARYVRPPAARNIDRSVDVEVRKPAVPAAPASRGAPYRPTIEGERALAMVGALMSEGVGFLEAVHMIGWARIDRRLGRTLSRVSDDIYSGTSMLDALQRERRVFGDMVITYLRLGENHVGGTESLLAYLRMRQEQREVGGWRPRARFRLTTRRFALAFAGALDVSGNVPGSLQCASTELRPRLQRRLGSSMESIKEGEPLVRAIPIRIPLILPGFERAFAKLVDIGEETSSLPAVLRACARL